LKHKSLNLNISKIKASMELGLQNTILFLMDQFCLVGWAWPK
jgi:hypothetical protein